MLKEILCYSFLSKTTSKVLSLFLCMAMESFYLGSVEIESQNISIWGRLNRNVYISKAENAEENRKTTRKIFCLG